MKRLIAMLVLFAGATHPSIGAPALPSYEILPVSHIHNSAGPAFNTFKAFKIDRKKNVIELCTATQRNRAGGADDVTCAPLQYPPPGLPNVAVSSVVVHLPGVPGPTMLANDMFWAIDVNTGQVTFCWVKCVIARE